MAGKLFPIISRAGIKKDGTNFSSQYYIDGQHCRFYRGLPRKIGGYKQLIGGLPNQPRGIYVAPNTPNFNVYFGDFQSLKYFTIDQDGNRLTGLIDITPAGFIPDINNTWQFQTMYSAVSDENLLIAYAGTNLESVTNTRETNIYAGPLLGGAPLTPIGKTTSGGILVLHPYLFDFGNDGFVRISNANDPASTFEEARVTDQKIIYGLPARAGNTSPGGLLWSLNSLIRVTQVGTNDVIWKFDTVTSQSSVLSSNSIIEMDGVYYWAAIDRFLQYSGAVTEIPNQLNLNYFFLNLNYAQRQKVWATKVPQYGEIWWFFPIGNSEECNAAVIYNVREKSWYDTSMLRGSGYYEQVFADPIWSDTVIGGADYAIWQHESGVDQNIDGTLTAIDSYFETSEISFIALGPTGQWAGDDRGVNLYSVELDARQDGEMSLVVKGRPYARGDITSSAPYVFGPLDTKIDLREEQRILSLRFESNQVGGFYEMGQMLLNLRTGDGRP